MNKCLLCGKDIITGARNPQRLHRACRRRITMQGMRFCVHPRHGEGAPWGEGDRMKDDVYFYRRQYSYCKKCQVAQTGDNNKRARAMKAEATA